ncbi:MAG: phytanoyl-CoA dioxygenase family protein [Candidatus Latescibacteria bacterium]|jgi:ectoine hydroxylase-related dioxygenase (phytanoyl-CoA dioxygenase family)|nr:phytanoyl-CoA dioxygenase family protein [Candidatus Latescibacterota bacterium]
MSIAMTGQQERDFEDKGFIILEDFLHQDELDRLLTAICEVADNIRQAKGLPPDAPFAVRNALAHHEAFLDLIDHPRILPLVVDAIGWNIQIRTTHLDYRPPYPKGQIESGKLDIKNGPDHKGNYRNTVWHPDLAGDYIFEAPSLDGRLPFMEVKVFYVLSDQSASNSGNLWLAPGTHKRTPQALRDVGGKVDPSDSIELKLPPGAAVLWRTATWHCVGPNLSDKTRKVLHVGYHYRWLRPTDYMQQDPDLIARSSPIRRQLLGALAPGSDPMGDDPEFHPASAYWLAQNEDDVPLRAWAEAHARSRTSAREPL